MRLSQDDEIKSPPLEVEVEVEVPPVEVEVEVKVVPTSQLSCQLRLANRGNCTYCQVLYLSTPTQICRFFNRSEGCRFGEMCRFHHGTQNLCNSYS